MVPPDEGKGDTVTLDYLAMKRRASEKAAEAATRRLAICTCRECGIVFRMQLRYVWECRENFGPYCPAGCNGNAETADGSSTVDVDA